MLIGTLTLHCNMTTNKRPSSKKAKRGPKPETLKIEGDWKDAVTKALAKGKPPKAK